MHARSLWCWREACQANKREVRTQQKRDAAARVRAKQTAVRRAVREAEEELELDPGPFRRELAVVAARARRQGDPGRKPCARATYRLARAEGRETTREAALDLAAELVSWAERLRPTPSGPSQH